MTSTQVPAGVEQAQLAAEAQALLTGERLADPYPIWSGLREESPAVVLDNAVVAGRFADVKELISNELDYSSKFHITGSRAESIVAGFPPDVQAMWRELAAFDANVVTRTDTETHTRLRRIAHRFFTPRRISELDSRIQAIVDSLLERAAEQDSYDQRQLGRELALSVVMDVIGTPDVDRAHLFALADAIGRYFGTTDAEIVRAAHSARRQTNAYIEDVIIAEHLRNPTRNELLATLMDAKETERMSPTETVALVSVLITGGIETSSVLLANGVLELLTARSQWELLCADRSLVPTAVEELMRFVSPAQWTSRIAKRDLEIGGVPIRVGTTVIAALAAANRDPRVYRDPDVLDVRRGAPHVGLGFGPHFCLGASLIRNEARIMFETLTGRYPATELAVDRDELEWFGNSNKRSVSTLPLALGPVAGR
jgi:cytochrome P450